MQLSDFDLSRKLENEKYEKLLKEKQIKLVTIGRKVYENKIPVVLMFEGWDASGKGGAIKRLTAYIDPRGYTAYGVGAPTEEEKTRPYLWRFWTKLPAGGHAAIFDRSWYGRVLVERVEKLATEAEWKRAYKEINKFEKTLEANGTVVIKIFLHISKAEQLRRFQARKKNKLTNWKLTAEDWRNRKKWSEYEKATNDMLKKTHTKHTPWYVVASDDKKFARIAVADAVITAVEKALKKRKVVGRR
jgi:polyphosphate kinase 2 (PPK2 family)